MTAVDRSRTYERFVHDMLRYEPGLPLVEANHVGHQQIVRADIVARCGGVGYYPASDFVHVDTGCVRMW